MDEAPSLRVLVRGTAARSLSGDAMVTFGASPCCDVQASGDPSVMPLHLTAFPVVGGVVVVDTWSPHGTAISGRGRHGERLMPVLGPHCDAALAIPIGERVELLLGERTTIIIEAISRHKGKDFTGIAADHRCLFLDSSMSENTISTCTMTDLLSEPSPRSMSRQRSRSPHAMWVHCSGTSKVI